MHKHNFFAGPAILPAEVLKEASEAVKEFQPIGLSLIEISHRHKESVAIMEEAIQHIRKLFNLDDSYHVLFLQGGASTQFFTLPYNILSPEDTADYVDTGSWSAKAIKEAKLFGQVREAGSSKESNYNYIPKELDINPTSKYLHITTNNTIYGTQYKNYPTTDIPLIADMSSDIFSKEIDASQFSMIYAGAQKNMGPAGTTLVIIKHNILNKPKGSIPTMVDYRTHIEKESMFNTPPMFAIYCCMLTLRWIKNLGGLQAMEERNNKKGALLYNEIDRNPLFKGTAAVEDRSLMNITFVCNNPEIEGDFLQMAGDAGIMGIKGHRSVGGFRASTYNALEYKSVEVLVNLMQEFEHKFG